MRKAALDDMLLDLPFALKMRQTRVTVGADNRAVHKVLHPCCLRGISQRLSLANLPVEPGLHEVLDGEHAASALHGAFHRCGIIQVTLD